MCRVSHLFRDICTKPLYSKYGDEALLWSTVLGEERTFQLALKYGPDIDCVNEESHTPLHIAAQFGRTSMSERLVAGGATVSLLDDYFRSPIYFAVKNEHVQIVQLLVHHGADVNKPHADVQVDACLIVAARSGRADIIQLLLDHGADVNATSENRESALGVACDGGHFEATKLLLQYGVGPAKCDRDRNSPLYTASAKGYLKIVKILLEVTPDISIDSRNDDGWTPLHAAARGGHLKVVKMLVKRGADVRALHSYKGSPLFCGVTSKQAAVCKYLIEKGADVCQGDDRGHTPLTQAVKYDDIEITKLLLNHGAGVAGTVRPFHETCLHLACHAGEGKLEIVKLLVQHGANVTARNRAGECPIDLAISRDRNDIARFLYELRRVPTP